MSNNQAIDLNNLQIIDESEVPKTYRYTPYREMLKKVKKGKALVFDPSEVGIRISTVRAAIRRLQKKGEFKNIELSQRTVRGKQFLYIINPSDNEKSAT